MGSEFVTGLGRTARWQNAGVTRSADKRSRSPRPLRARLLPAFAVVITLGLAVSDWPLGWSFWVTHPLMSALVPGLVLLIVAAAVVDGFVRHREARRWRDVGGAAAGALTDHFSMAALVLEDLVGVDIGGHLDLEFDHHLSQARKRIAVLTGGHLIAFNYRLQVGGVTYDERVRTVLPTLLSDEAWRDSAWSCLALMCSRHAQLLAQWSSIYAAAADEENFRRLGSTVSVIELAHALKADISATQFTQDPTFPLDESLLDAAVSGAVDGWVSLAHAVGQENRHWNQVRASQASLGDRWGPLWVAAQDTQQTHSHPDLAGPERPPSG